MLRQSRLQASRASSAQMSQGLRGGMFQKLFKGYIFCFLVYSVGGYIFACETNLMKKHSVRVYKSLTHAIAALLNVRH